MRLKRYYDVLGLPENASKSEVKSRFRKLAKIYHPDRKGGNREKFEALVEAYEIVSGQRPSQVQKVSPSKPTTEERVKYAKQRKKEQQYKEYLENENYFRSLTSGFRWNLLKFSAWLGAIIVLVLIIELFLPKHYQQERIVAFSKTEVGSIYGGSLVAKQKLSSGEIIYFQKVFDICYVDPDILLVESAVFHNKQGVIPIASQTNRFYQINFDMGAQAYLLVPLFLLPLAIIFYRKKTFLFTLLYMISLYAATPLIFYFLFRGNRWIHLLTLGLTNL